MGRGILGRVKMGTQWRKERLQKGSAADSEDKPFLVHNILPRELPREDWVFVLALYRSLGALIYG